MDKLFQLTTSRRGRPAVRTSSKPSALFQLTTSRRGRRYLVCFLNISRIFQLTTSRRGRLKLIQNLYERMYFNSLPHAEVDQYHTKNHGTIISFQLTTSRRGRRNNRRGVIQLERFQLTTSRRGRLLIPPL